MIFKLLILLVYLSIFIFMAYISLRNPFNWNIFNSLDLKKQSNQNDVKNKDFIDKSWEKSNKQLNKLKRILDLPNENNEERGLNISEKQEVSYCLSEIASDLRDLPLRFQRFSGLVWLRIAKGFIPYRSERKDAVLDKETMISISDLLNNYQLGIYKENVKISYDSLIKLVFVIETGETPINRSSNKEYIKHFLDDVLEMRDIKGFIPSDIFVEKLYGWKYIAIKERDPYFYFPLIFLDNYRKEYVRFHCAIDEKGKLNYRLKLLMIKDDLQKFANALNRNDILEQYRICNKFLEFAEGK